ncbi:salicylate synthase [Skermania sp. ID1734]|nr:salicylate synthase [Skermania sp. ID1734]TSE01689.1 salicylate synthase [Skermania sp. ID1734]
MTLTRVPDPLSALTRLAAAEDFVDFVVYEQPGRWVFAANPVASVTLEAEQIRIRVGDEDRRQRWTGSPAKVLESALAVLFPESPSERGAYGWLGFALCAYSLGAERHLTGDVLAHLMVPSIEVVIDAHGDVTMCGGTSQERGAVRRALAGADVAVRAPAVIDTRSDSSDYRGRATAAIAEISAGAYEKVILSRRVDVPFAVDMAQTYRLGRQHNTPARSFLLCTGGLEAAGFSPELVVAVNADGLVTTEPLAGTRAFGRGDRADQRARADLVSDPKEIVEHAVSVRTAMTEVASVAAPGTPSVSDFMAVRERGSVQHLASTVQGRLAPNRTAWDAVEALFPSVTASGIPKASAVDAIFRLDDSDRGLYSGAVVAVSPNGALEATLVLRAVYQQGRNAWLRAGAGIIAQSDPEREFEETCEKLGSVAPYVVPATPTASNLCS